MLDPMDVYILDCGAEMFVCVGRGSEPEEKRTAMMNAQVRVCVSLIHVFDLYVCGCVCVCGEGHAV